MNIFCCISSRRSTA